MNSQEEINIVLTMLFESYEENDVAIAVIDKFDYDAEESILEHCNTDEVIKQTLEVATESDIAEMLDELEHEDYFNIFTTRLDTQRMLKYLEEHLNEVTLEDLELIIKNK